MMSSLPQDVLKQAVQVLHTGGIIVFPTDTAYGLGCDYQDQNAIQRILRVKGRTDIKFTVIAGSLEQVQKHFVLNSHALTLAQRYWPGPFSVVVNEQFAVRVPDNDIAREIALAYGSPLIATSANITKRAPLYALQEVQAELGAQNVDLWVNGGVLPERPPSTVVRVVGNRVEIIRQGAIHLTY